MQSVDVLHHLLGINVLKHRIIGWKFHECTHLSLHMSIVVLLLYSDDFMADSIYSRANFIAKQHKKGETPKKKTTGKKAKPIMV